MPEIDRGSAAIISSIRRKALQELAARVEFIFVDGVSHSRIAAQFDQRSHRREHVARLLNPCKGNMRVWIACAEKYGSAVQSSRIIPWRAGWADQSARRSE